MLREQLEPCSPVVFSQENLITASFRTNWDIDQTTQALYPPGKERDLEGINKVLAEALTIYNEILGPFPYVSITFADSVARNAQTPSQYTQLHLTRPRGDIASIAIDIVTDAKKGDRYSDISSRVFGSNVNGEIRPIPESLGNHYTIDHARHMFRFAMRCQEAVARFQNDDVVLQVNPQGIQEFVDQPLGGFKDTGGQNKYVECFARALGKTTHKGKDQPMCQIILNRSGPSQTEILASYTPQQFGGDPAVRKGVHFFPDENVCLSFVEDSQPQQFRLKEDSHPHWEKTTGENSFDSAHIDVVRVSEGRLANFGIADGMYMMQDPGPMKELAEASLAMLDYFKFGAKSENKTVGRKIILADHYADAAYLGEFISREIGTRFESYFFIHSLGTFKAEGLDYPNKLTSDVDGAAKLESQFRLTDRILSELWVVQRCKHHLIANSDRIAKHTHEYLNARHEPPTMIAVDDTANGHIDRVDRRTLARETFEEMHRLYLDTCNNTELGEIVPEASRLTLEELLDAQLVFERSRHAEAESKGKWAVVKAMAIAQSDVIALAKNSPNRVLIVNVNMAARYGTDDNFRNEINTIIGDLKSIRKNGGHVIVQSSFDYHFGLDVAKVADCYLALPAFEPFGMGVIEAAAAGTVVIARSDVPSVKELLSHNVSTIKFQLRNSQIKVGIGGGAILVGGRPDEDTHDQKQFVEAAYNGAAAAINAVTLGTPPTTPALSFNPKVLGAAAADLVKNSHYNWDNVAKRFLREVYGDAQ